MPTYNLIDYSDNYSKTSGRLWQRYRDKPALNNDIIANFPGNTHSFNLNKKSR